MPVRIVPTAETYTGGFHAAVDAVARERRFLALVEGPPLAQTESFVRSVLSGEGVQFLALTEADRVVGWCDVIRLSREGFRHCGRLGMGLLPDYRGQGLGRQLALAALAAARDAGMTRIELEVFASNVHAIALYESLGFVREGVRHRARFIDGRYDDNVLMAIF
ncbi:MAG TPA: GNAT family N-acetyltransferase [Thermoanaerobaculia bacterium]|nr:GNAT family N-acetyltransferase [Thermoanaerobaculia bacterium]